MREVIETLLVDLDQADIKLWLDGEKLRFSAPSNALTMPLRERLQAIKSDLIEQLRQAGVYSVEQNLPFAHRDTIPPSFAQKHFGGLQRLNPSDCFYNVLFGFHLSGCTDLDLLKQSFNRIIERHDFLRTTLHVIDGELNQIIAPTGEIDFVLTDITAEANQKNAIDSVLHNEWHTPFNLTEQSSLRVRLLRLSETEHILALCMHNVLFETGALSCLLHELGTHYADLLFQRPCSLPPLPIQYADYVRWQQSLLTKNMDSRLAYWHDWFRNGEPPLATLACAKQDTLPTSFSAKMLWLNTSPHLMCQLKMLSKQAGVTLFHVLLTAYVLTLHRYSGYSDIVTGTTFINRNHWKLEPLIGSLLNVIALRFDVQDNLTVLTLLKNVRDTVLMAFAQQEVPFAYVAPLLEPNKQRTTPLFRTVFTFFEDTAYQQLQLPNHEITFIDTLYSNVMRPDIYPAFWEKQTSEGSILVGYWQYKEALYSEEKAHAMLNTFESILEAMASNPTQIIHNL